MFSKILEHLSQGVEFPFKKQESCRTEEEEGNSEGQDVPPEHVWRHCDLFQELSRVPVMNNKRNIIIVNSSFKYKKIQNGVTIIIST